MIRLKQSLTIVLGALLLAACNQQAVFRGSDVTGSKFGRDFHLTDHTGKPRALADFRGKGVVIFFGSGTGDPLLQRLFISRLERATGAKVELHSMSIRWLALRVTLRGLVIHGNEPSGTEPLLTAEEVQAALRVDSFWARRLSLRELLIQRPHVHILVRKNGATNVPTPARPSAPGRPDSQGQRAGRRPVREAGQKGRHEVSKTKGG